MAKSNCFSRPVNVFHGRTLPEEGYLLGYACIITFLEDQGISVPLPTVLSMRTDKYQKYRSGNWMVYTQKHKPQDDLPSHLMFALKYEALDLYILKSLFGCWGAQKISQIILNQPTGRYSRKIWFLYEWFFEQKLDIPDLKAGTYVEILDPSLQYAGPVRNSTRHRVKNNLPGVSQFCPLIRKTEVLENFIRQDFSNAIELGLHAKDKDLIRRAAAYLLLKDSKASFAIEGELPSNQRALHWGKAIGQAGKNPLSLSEIERLQGLVFGNKRLKYMGIRQQEGFIGEHDRENFQPLPEHISARFKDLPQLMQGILDTDKLLEKGTFDPVLASALIAFGFVFIHPLADGNGRLHRYLIHHKLIELGFTKRGFIFPVSAAILDRIDRYQTVLESYSLPRLSLISWKTAPDYNVEILNETADLYRFYDMSEQAEFLYACIEHTLSHTIPTELEYLEKYDQMLEELHEQISLPNTQLDLLIKILHQNEGKLSKKKWEKHFSELSEEDVEWVEACFRRIFIST